MAVIFLREAGGFSGGGGGGGGGDDDHDDGDGDPKQRAAHDVDVDDDHLDLAGLQRKVLELQAVDPSTVGDALAHMTRLSLLQSRYEP